MLHLPMSYVDYLKPIQLHKDIMLTADYPLNKITLGSLSAWRVGIAPKNKIFNQFDTEK